MDTMDIILFVVIMAIYISIMVVIFLVARNRSANKEKVRDWLTKEEAEVFIGENSTYFLNKWKDRPESIFKGWNWAAAFFTVEWLAYRKMYYWSAIMIPGLLLGRGSHLSSLAAIFYLPLSRFLNGWLAILISILLARFIFGGLLGNTLYREAAMKSLKESLQMSESARLEYLKSKGGTNVIAPVVTVVIQVAAIIAVGVFYH